MNAIIAILVGVFCYLFAGALGWAAEKMQEDSKENSKWNIWFTEFSGGVFALMGLILIGSGAVECFLNLWK